MSERMTHDATKTKTVIGPGTRVAGALSGSNDIIVEGVVEGAIEGQASVTIAVGARVHGPVRARDVIVAGELNHPVCAAGTVRLCASARMTGDIEAGRIAVDEGATFEGNVRMRRADATTTATVAAASPEKPPQKTSPARLIPARRDIPELATPGRRRFLRKTT
jgi:cytoskeletal protein CcmA (bactofilin family)